MVCRAKGLKFLRSRIRFNPKSSIQGVVAWTAWHMQRDSDGNLRVVNLWSNDGNRKLNLNYFTNRWNRNCRFAFVRNSLYFSPLTPGFSFKICRLQPPSIFPIWSSCSERAIYFLLSKALTSQDICRKNFNKSSLVIAFWT